MVLFTASLQGVETVMPCAVSGYERLRAIGGDWKAEAGELLFSELSCAACHQGGALSSAPSFSYKSGPDLSAAGDRLRADYLRAYLADPAKVKPGTTMPHLFAGMDEKKKAEVVEDLAHHLMGQRSKKKSNTMPVEGSSKAGEALFRSVGCVACHGTQPMGALGEKYAPGELARFLLSPLSVRPSGRMPDQKIGKKDAAHLAAYLAPGKPEKVEEFVVDAERAKRGRKSFLSMGCVSCHGKPQEAKSVPLVDLQRGCLSEEPKAGVPQYPLTEEQRDAIRAALTARSKSPDQKTLEPKLAIRRVMLQRNCFACHARDGLGGPAPDVAVHFTSTKDDLGDLGRLPPPLDGVGAKFQRPALENVLRGRDPVRHYMRVRMPGFGEELARSLSIMLAKNDADVKPHTAPIVVHKDPD
ncbi:MAG: c-type cytochrome, partial [Roseimicrobium sp.]